MNQPFNPRRRLGIAGALVVVMGLSALNAPAQAQGQAQPAAAAPAAPAPKLNTLGVFALLGDSLQIALPADATDSRLDRTLRDSVAVKDLGFDQAVLRAVSESVGRLQPAAKLKMYRSTTPMAPADQRALADGVARAELPAWIVSAIEADKLGHVLIVTRSRGEASFPVEAGFTIGRGRVEGVGFYLDTSTGMKDRSSGDASIGFLGAYAQLRLQLMDTSSGDIVASQDVRVGQIHVGRYGAEVSNIWGALGPREKVEVLRTLVQDNVARVMPALLAGGGAP